MNPGANLDARSYRGGGADSRKRNSHRGGGMDGSLQVIGAGDAGSKFAVGADADGT